jgi:hypothetical protein
MRASEKTGQTLRHELKVIETLQREWNELIWAERTSVAKVSPDLSLFFRRGLANVDRRSGNSSEIRGRLAVQAVWCELVSKHEFPVPREETGNFSTNRDF